MAVTTAQANSATPPHMMSILERQMRCGTVVTPMCFDERLNTHSKAARKHMLYHLYVFRLYLAYLINSDSMRLIILFLRPKA